MQPKKIGAVRKRIKRSIKRYVRVVVFSLLLVAKLLHLPKGLFPGPLRRVLEHWSVPMLWVYVSSLGTRAYIDEPCALTDPPDYGPKARVAEPFVMTTEEIRRFYERGFAGPYRAISAEAMAELSKQLEEELERPSRAFGFKTVRDRHLDLKAFYELFTQPAITERLAQILGPDVMIWRSQVFNQMPGAPPITWHQATTYMLEDYQRPILEPAEPSHIFQLTVWIAFDHATIENGCLQFIPGTHRRTHTVRLGTSKDGFYKAHFALEMDEPRPEDIVSMELEPGEFVVFSERVIHGSPGNRSNRRRLGVNFRAIKPDTHVYRGQTEHYAMHLEQTWSLENWGVLMLRGEDAYGYNRTLTPAWER